MKAFSLFFFFHQVRFEVLVVLFVSLRRPSFFFFCEREFLRFVRGLHFRNSHQTTQNPTPFVILSEGESERERGENRNKDSRVKKKNLKRTLRKSRDKEKKTKTQIQFAPLCLVFFLLSSHFSSPFFFSSSFNQTRFLSFPLPFPPFKKTLSKRT